MNDDSSFCNRKTSGLVKLTGSLLLGSGEKHRRYVEKRYVISIKSLVFFGTLTYLIMYVRVPNIPVPYNVPDIP